MPDVDSGCADTVGAGAPEKDEIDAELDLILTEEIMKAGENALAAWSSDPGLDAYMAFVAMWRAMRTSQKKAQSQSNT